MRQSSILMYGLLTGTALFPLSCQNDICNLKDDPSCHPLDITLETSGLYSNAPILGVNVLQWGDRSLPFSRIRNSKSCISSCNYIQGCPDSALDCYNIKFQENSQKNNDFVISLSKAQLDSLDGEAATISVGGKWGNGEINLPAIPPKQLAWSLAGTTIETTAVYPTIETLGLVGNTLVALRSGMDSNAYPRKIIRRYAWVSGQLAKADVAGDYFAVPTFKLTTQAAVSSNFVYLLRDPNDMGTNLELRRCPVNPTDLTQCTLFKSPLLPADTQAFAVSADDSTAKGVAVVASKDGVLSAVPLDPASTMAWNPLPLITNQPSHATVKLAIGNLDGDTYPDIIAAWQSMGSTTWGVLKGSQSGVFTPDPDLTMKLRSVAGALPVDALSLSDVDQDGRADVVLSNGWTLRVLLNQGDSFAEAWKTTIPSTNPGTKLTAIGIGKLDSTIDNTKLLDIVVGSDGIPDPSGTGMGALYLQAFRGMYQ